MSSSSGMRAPISQPSRPRMGRHEVESAHVQDKCSSCVCLQRRGLLQVVGHVDLFCFFRYPFRIQTVPLFVSGQFAAFARGPRHGHEVLPGLGRVLHLGQRRPFVASKGAERGDLPICSSWTDFTVSSFRATAPETAVPVGVCDADLGPGSSMSPLVISLLSFLARPRRDLGGLETSHTQFLWDELTRVSALETQVHHPRLSARDPRNHEHL